MKCAMILRGFLRFDLGTEDTISERLPFCIFVIIQSTISINCNLMPTWNAGMVCKVSRKNNLPQIYMCQEH